MNPNNSSLAFRRCLLSPSLGIFKRRHPVLFGLSVLALKEPRVGKDEQLECVLDAAKVPHVDHGKAVELVEAGELEPDWPPPVCQPRRDHEAVVHEVPVHPMQRRVLRNVHLDKVCKHVINPLVLLSLVSAAAATATAAILCLVEGDFDGRADAEKAGAVAVAKPIILGSHFFADAAKIRSLILILQSAVSVLDIILFLLLLNVARPLFILSAAGRCGKRTFPFLLMPQRATRSEGVRGRMRFRGAIHQCLRIILNSDS
jgi:hypothetical protein